MFFGEILHTDTRWFKDYESQEKNYLFLYRVKKMAKKKES